MAKTTPQTLNQMIAAQREFNASQMEQDNIQEGISRTYEKREEIKNLHVQKHRRRSLAAQQWQL